MVAKLSRRLVISWVIVEFIITSSCSLVSAEDQLVVPVAWADTISFLGHAEGGIAFNANAPAGRQNFGNPYTDKADAPQLNQLVMGIQRPINSQSGLWDIGFKLQGLFGTDARYSQNYAETDHLIHSRNQFNVAEATISLHAPYITERGLDLKIGQFPSPMGAEAIDASANPLYSHSYIYFFGTPEKNAGILSTLHATAFLDLFAGFDTGVNGGITKNGDLNQSLKGQFGFGLNLLQGNLTVAGYSHIGAENPPNQPHIPNGALRYINDITTTWKIQDTLTLINDLNYMQDDSINAIGYGMAQYATYILNDHWSITGRGEVWRDNSNFFVAAYPGNFDYVNSSRGLANAIITASHATTYSEWTVGLTYKPDVPKSIEGVMIRPEFRYDRALNGSRPFNNNRDVGSLTPAIDIIIPF